MSVIELVRAAGPLIVVLFALSLYVVYITIVRAQALARIDQDLSGAIERVRSITLERGTGAALRELDGGQVKYESPALKVMRAGLRSSGRGPNGAKAAMTATMLAEDPKIYGGLTALSTAAQIAPLFGLLGTVFGMVRSFIVFSQVSAPTPAQLALGISEALVNTAGGLIVAIMAYVARNYLRSRADRIALQAERVCEELPGWLPNTEMTNLGQPKSAELTLNFDAFDSVKG